MGNLFVLLPEEAYPLLLVLLVIGVLAGLARWRLLVGFLLIRSLVEPAELLSAGAEMIRHRDFTTRFRTLGLPETDHLIDIYNEMVDQLREERRKAQERHFFLDKILAGLGTGPEKKRPKRDSLAEPG